MRDCSCSCPCVCERKAFQEKLLKAYGEPQIADEGDDVEFFDVILTDQEVATIQEARDRVQQRMQF